MKGCKGKQLLDWKNERPHKGVALSEPQAHKKVVKDEQDLAVSDFTATIKTTTNTTKIYKIFIFSGYY